MIIAIQPKDVKGDTLRNKMRLLSSIVSILHYDADMAICEAERFDGYPYLYLAESTDGLFLIPDPAGYEFLIRSSSFSLIHSEEQLATLTKADRNIRRLPKGKLSL